MKQSELILRMSDEELKKQLILSQLLFLFISIILSFFFFDSVLSLLQYFQWNLPEITYYGVTAGFIIVMLDLIIIRFVPKHFYDDGGINEKLFRNRTIGDIFLISIIVAISEELLFRGVIQVTFGYGFASLLFAFVHVRYLKKPVLFISILFVSFYLGYLFELTGNLLVTITAHFVVDFLLGLFIRFRR